MKIALGADHAGFALKTAVADHLTALGHEVLDGGTNSPERTDYPIYGSRAARLVTNGEADFGVICCGSGIGISIAANKVPGARCVVCTEPYSAAMARRHNDANMLALGERFVGVDMALACVDAFLAADFEGGRHAGRVALFEQIESGTEL
ncbi:ribose 5-phosphate isomerase B [Mobilicoccus pelagius]|uniref:Ribose 5-phosphate isomerase B n=1 Tax=Mobilicoccus pelagius NBRC 104925 TaxID=1089455 RepID=H5UP60_9MICO|nr:ribose 5-phosphate isomerase B [Mobilicoccus pelagius]GAB47518.1 ribose 5-phosphate isomerase B [Mobilicoccus pelagius NBRC 104925]